MEKLTQSIQTAKEEKEEGEGGWKGDEERGQKGDRKRKEREGESTELAPALCLEVHCTIRTLEPLEPEARLSCGS